MELRRLCWPSVAAEQFEPTVGFFRDVLGFDVAFAEPTTVELPLASGDRVQVFAPGDP